MSGDTRIEPEAFAQELAPCLALVGGSGMSRETRREWLNAAYRAIGDVPADVLKRAARQAMLTADHPSKIVPAITRAIEAEREADRARAVGRIVPIAFIPEHRLPVPHEETQAILKAAGLSLTGEADAARPTPIAGGTGAPGRIPSREDYINMGVDPAVLDQLNAEPA